MRLLPPPTPPNDLDPVDAGEEARAKAITQVSDHADPGWMSQALDAVHHLAQTQEQVTSDDVWDWLEDYVTVETHDNRAMGAVMTEAGRQEWLHRTEATVLSRRPINHRRPIRVWTSLIYDPAVREAEEAEALDGEPPPPPPPRHRTPKNSEQEVEVLADTQVSEDMGPVIELGSGITAVEVDALPENAGDGWSGRVEVAIEMAATQIAALRALSGQGRRRYWMMACPDHGYWMLTTGPKGLEGVSTWQGACHTCRRAEAGDLVNEISVPSYPQSPLVDEDTLVAAQEMLGEAEAPEEANTPEDEEAPAPEVEEAPAPESEEATGPTEPEEAPAREVAPPPPPRRRG